MATGILKYKLVTRINPQNKSEQPKWYAKAVQDRTIDFEGLVTHMSEHNSPYSRGVIHGVLTDMLDCVKELVLDGKSVRLGDLGSLQIGISSKGAVTEEDFSDTLIKKARINFRPGLALMGALSNLTFAKVKPRYTKEDKEAEEEGGEDLTD